MNLTKLLVAGAIAGFALSGNPKTSYSQKPAMAEQDTIKQEKLLPELNFYFETGRNIHYNGMPEFQNYAEAWLSRSVKEERNGNPWFYYGDTDGDGYYEYAYVKNFAPPFETVEKFSFNLEKKEIDYTLEIRDFCGGTNCETIVKKIYEGIDQKEAKIIGEDLEKRVKKILNAQINFSRFTPMPLENLVREEGYYSPKIINGKLAGNSRIPLEKFLSEEEMKKIESYPVEKAERERIEAEKRKDELARAEAARIETERFRQEMEEKARIEREEKMLKTKFGLKVGGGFIGIKNRGGHSGDENDWSNWKQRGNGKFAEFQPQLLFVNKKGRGISVGGELSLGGLKEHYERYEWKYADLVAPGSFYDYIPPSYNLNISNEMRDEKERYAIGVSTGYISPIFEIFIKAGRQELNGKWERTKYSQKQELYRKYDVYTDTYEIIHKETFDTITEGGEYVNGKPYCEVGFEIYPLAKIKNVEEYARKFSIFASFDIIRPLTLGKGYGGELGLKYSFGKKLPEKRPGN